jgi:hypothetical protein
MIPKPSRLRDERVLQNRRDQPCIVCGRSAPSDPSHIRSRGAGGPDTDWNVVSMCRDHHNEWHGVGRLTFVSRYPAFGQFLKAMGWVIEAVGQGVEDVEFWHPKVLAGEDDAEMWGPVCDGCGALGGDCYCDEEKLGCESSESAGSPQAVKQP